MPFSNNVSRPPVPPCTPDTSTASANTAPATGRLNLRGNTHVLRLDGAAVRFAEFRNKAGTPEMNLLRPKLGNAQTAEALNSRAFVPDTAYFLSDKDVAAIDRTEVAAPPSKPYVGYNRVSQQLSHMATALYHVMTNKAFASQWAPHERGKINPIEIQLAVIGDKLHVSSNFHSDKLARALGIALAAPAPGHEKDLERSPVRNKVAVRAATCLRHFRKFRELANASPQQANVIEARLRGEIAKKMGVPSGAERMSTEAVADQGVLALRTIRRVLTNEADQQFPSLVVHAPPTFARATNNPLPPKVTETRHAEQNIEDDLGADAQRQYEHAIAELRLRDGTPVVIPMAGKFVACAVCAEAEHAMQARGEGGVFDPDNTSHPFVLHRSGERIGHAYANEVQHLATHALNADPTLGARRASTIRENFASTPEKTLAWKARVAEAMIPNRTDSESEASTDH